MKIIYKETSAVIPYDNNPRFNESAVDAVAKSIKEFGFRQPIVVDEAGVIIVGHTRYLAALKLGLEKVPVHVAKDLTAEQIKAYRIADNKTGELAQWDFDKLKIELGDLSECDFDLDLLAFDCEELEKLLNGDNDAVVTEGLTDPEEVPETPKKPASRSGEIYRLGEHLLLCGDACSQEDVERLTGGQMAELLLQDPPYNVSYQGATEDKLTITNDNMSDEDFLDFLTAAFTNAANYLNKGGAFYIWYGDNQSVNFRLACKMADLDIKQCLIWEKNQLIIGRQDYQWIHEPCLYGWRPGEKHRWYSDRSQRTVMNFDKPLRNAEHPTMKPVALFEYQMCNSSKRGDVVLDMFAGSGTTVIAAERTGRVARVMELDPKYCDVIRRRWAEFVHGENCDWQALTPAVENQSSPGEQ
ncbi:MAG: DNA modification methylase [Sedimentisphaeraceae bacterium JB056]